MKSSKRKSALAMVALALVLILVALPASAATPPQDIHVHADVDFDVESGTMHGTGHWWSEGLVTSSGDAEEAHFVAGWPPDSVFKTAHLTETWRDAYGEINIETQLNVDEWTIVSSIDVQYEGTGHWVIKSGTGAYANLKGEGSVTFVGSITPTEYPKLSVSESYEGVAHFEP